MNFELGYVAQNLSMGISPSHTITVANFNKLHTEKEKKEKLLQIAKENLNNTLEILKWNAEHDIFVYRFSSKLIPLATWNGFSWDYIKTLKKEWKQIGDFVKKNKMRVSAHPDHFSVINTPYDEVFNNSVKDFIYHQQFLKAMGLEKEAKLVTHVGGKYGDKEKGKKLFIHRFKELPEEVQKIILLENDDKVYNSEDVLEICKKINIPMVLDVHHESINPSTLNRKTVIEKAFGTWKEEDRVPKIHFSSPRDEKNKRAHADYIYPEDFFEFLKIAKKINQDCDIMLEAKAKDLSLLRLREEIRKTLPVY